MEQFEEIIEMEAGHILNVFGEYDKYVKKLEKYLSVTIVDRDGGVRITGSRKHVEQTAAILNRNSFWNYRKGETRFRNRMWIMRLR